MFINTHRSHKEGSAAVTIDISVLLVGLLTLKYGSFKISFLRASDGIF